jgi:hypothetical protein
VTLAALAWPILSAMGKALYLGKEFDAKKGILSERLSLDPGDLLTHGLIVGMTGSGKTGLAVGLIEEVLRLGVPVLAIDPKGDLGNLLLLFERLEAAEFRPWIDEDAARRDGKTADAAATDAAQAWRKGLEEWGLGSADIASLKRAREATIFTPGSTAGVPLNVLQSLESPSVPFESAQEDLRDEIGGIVAGLLGLLAIDADPLQSRQAVFLSNLIEHAWREGRSLTLEGLIAAVADPPFEKIGVLPVDTVFPRREREALMLALNNLLGAPAFETWRQGEPLDIDTLLRTRDGRPRLSVIYTAHLADAERLFATALLLNRVKTWMRRQSGTSELRALIYMDEIFGYFPPHPANPPTKRPLLTLLKQARSQGVSIVLATQNPVDLDYKGLANMGTWLVGKLQTDQDRERLRGGLVGSGADGAAIERLMNATQKRVFLLHDVHRKAPCLMHSRWTMAYLRGPLTRDEVARLTPDRAPSTRAAGAPGAVASATGRTDAGAVPAGPPVVPAPWKSHFLRRFGGELADPHLFVKFAVRYKGLEERLALRAFPLTTETAAEIVDGQPIELDEAELASEAPAGLRYGDLPALLTGAGAKAIEKALRERLADKLAVTVFEDPVTGESSRPGETRESFGERLRSGGLAEGDRGKLTDQIEKKQRELAAREQDLTGRRWEKWAAVGTAVLSNMGLFRGRRRTISGASTVFTKNRMENTAEARVEGLKAEIAELEARLAALTGVDTARFEERQVVPGRGDVKILRYDLVWVY